jgi:hypothetical protein
VGLLAASACALGDAKAQSVAHNPIASAEAAVAQAEAAAPKCSDRFVRLQIENDAANLRVLLQSARFHQNDAAAAASIYSLNPMLESLVRDLQSCLKVDNENAAIHARCHGPLRIGMTASEVLKSEWCEPSHINTTKTAGRIYEQWIYEGARISNEHEGYLYLEDGILTAIQTR